MPTACEKTGVYWYHNGRFFQQYNGDWMDIPPKDEWLTVTCSDPYADAKRAERSAWASIRHLAKRAQARLWWSGLWEQSL